MVIKWSLPTRVGVIYLCLQCLTLIALSIAGYRYVRQTWSTHKDRTATGVRVGDASVELQEYTKRQKQSFCGSWLKTVWKMRSVYSSFLVHSFDIATDLIVIIEWLTEPDQAHIDSKLMAYFSIGVIVFHKLVSSFAIWIVEKNLLRAVLQLFDFLIFQEIYYGHNKILSNLRNSKSQQSYSKKDAIESTMTFKYIRSLEATYESMPQSVLQLIYVMRTSSFGSGPTSLVIGLSILQSLTSMTNSILKDDNSRGMQGTKWKKYKRRLPPTIPFLRHAFSRASQVISRVTILSLFWTVVGGLAFGFLALFEVLCLFGGAFVVMSKITSFSIENAFLLVSGLILLPPELIFSDSFARHEMGWIDLFFPCFSNFAGVVDMFIACGVNYCACVGMGRLLSHLWCLDLSRDDYVWPSARLGISFIEILIIIIVGIVNIDNEDEINYLFNMKRAGAVFIVCIVSFLIDCGYLRLFPSFSLPLGANPRSKWGFAMAGELQQLQKLKVDIALNFDELKKDIKTDGNGEGKEKEKEKDTALELQLQVQQNGGGRRGQLNRGQTSKRHQTSKRDLIINDKNIIRTQTTFNLTSDEMEWWKQRSIAAFWEENHPKKTQYNILDTQSQNAIKSILDVGTPQEQTDISLIITPDNRNHVLRNFPITYTLVAMAYEHERLVERFKDKGARSHRALKGDVKMAKEILELQNVHFDVLEKIKPDSLWIKAKKGIMTTKELAQVFVDFETYDRNKFLPVTCATLALANGHHDVVEWLEQQGASKHKDIKEQEMNVELATKVAWDLDIPFGDGTKWSLCMNGDLDGVKNLGKQLGVDMESLWEEEYKTYISKNKGKRLVDTSGYEWFSCAGIAIAMAHWDILKWLDSQGAKAHKTLFNPDNLVQHAGAYQTRFIYEEGGTNYRIATDVVDIDNYIDMKSIEDSFVDVERRLKLETLNQEQRKIQEEDLENKKQISPNISNEIRKKIFDENGGEVKIDDINMGEILPDINYEGVEKYSLVYHGDLKTLQEKYSNRGGEFWDDYLVPYKEYPCTVAVFALANGKYDIVKWLEKKGAQKHLYLNNNRELAKKIVGREYLSLDPGTKWDNCWKGVLNGIEKLDFWDESLDRRQHIASMAATCAIFALANKQFDILDWLEEQGAKRHMYLKRNVKHAREIIDPYYDSWIE